MEEVTLIGFCSSRARARGSLPRFDPVPVNVSDIKSRLPRLAGVRGGGRKCFNRVYAGNAPTELSDTQ